jgi:hypothetical protein
MFSNSVAYVLYVLMYIYKSPQYQISQKPVRWEQVGRQTDGRMDVRTEMTKVLGPLPKCGNWSKNANISLKSF